MKQFTIFNQLTAMPKRLAMVLTVLFTLGVGSMLGAETTATLSFANKAQRTSFSTTKQVWEQNGITFTNDKSSSTNNVADYADPVRLYASSKITITAPGNMTIIVFDCNSTAYANAMKNSIGSSATASSDKVTVTLDGTSNTFIAKLTAQVRLDEITVTYEEACTKPTITFSNASYTIGGTALDLSTLFTSNSNGTVIYSVTNANNSTGATISGSNFTATAVGSATVTATQAAAGTYCEGSATATISVSKASCNKKVTVNKGTPSNGSFSISKTGTYETCDAPLVITLSNITPSAGYQFGAITQTGIGTGVTIDQANKTVTYAKNTSGTSTINVTFTALDTHSVTWKVNNTDYNVGDPTTQVYDGGQVTKLPTAPDPANHCGQVFAGWTTTPIDGATNKKPSGLFTTVADSPEITKDITFHAVFADYAD